MNEVLPHFLIFGYVVESCKMVIFVKLKFKEQRRPTRNGLIVGKIQLTTHR